MQPFVLKSSHKAGLAPGTLMHVGVPKAETNPYLRDLNDHVNHVVNKMDNLHDLLKGVLYLYLNIVSNRSNEVMKVLTIIATIFIPLTFIAGIYGMNFKYMPELSWHYAYFTVLGIMLAIGVGLMVLFKRKGWL